MPSAIRVFNGATWLPTGVTPELRSATDWPFTATGPANMPRGLSATFASTSHESTVSLRGGNTVSRAGTTTTIGTNFNINCAVWSVAVNTSAPSDAVWTLTDPSTSAQLFPVINGSPLRSGETGNGDFLTDFIQPDGETLYSLYKFGYSALDTTAHTASYRDDAWTVLNLKTSPGYADDSALPKYHRGPRACQLPASFGLIRRWEISKAQAGSWETAIRHTIAVAAQGAMYKRGSQNGGVSYQWPAFGSDYMGDRATQVLTPPASGSFTLSSGAFSTTQAYNVSPSDLQSAIQAAGGDFGSVTVSGSAGSSYSLASLRTNANTFTTSAGSITTPGTLYADTGLTMGGLFCLDPSVDITALGMTDPTAKAIAKALQDYGGYLVDTSSVLTCYAEVGAASLITQHQSAIATDLAKIRPHLLPITNNSPTSVGGGGVAVRSLAPAFG